MQSQPPTPYNPGMARKKLKPPPRFQLAMTPTPIEALGLSPDPKSGVNIFLKRDDMTGSELSGNKIRKLEFVLYDAVSRKSDTIITCGGIRSNHCRATAAICARAGLDCELYLEGKPTKIPDGNILLDTLFNAKIKYLTSKQYENEIDDIMNKRADYLLHQGRKPYIIPSGASNTIGMWGYVTAGIELKKQLDKAGITVDYIACAVGSGGTYAGLYIASLYLNWPVKILGYAVCHDTEYFINKIGSLVENFIEENDLNLDIHPSDLNIDDSYIGPGYAKIGKREASFIKTVAANSGVIFDPAYTGKAMLGLFDTIKKHKLKRKTNVVFIHTGGLFSIFSYKKGLFSK